MANTRPAESFAGARLPDFFIMGAMKAGTSSLRRLLSGHPDVFVHECEIPFFSVDDVTEHRAFSLRAHGKRLFQDFHDRYEDYGSWYAERFVDVRPDQLIGDASTSYMPSRRAALRLREQLPDAKLLFSLRDPGARTYSHYWHIVRTGWAVHTFDDILLYEPGSLLSRGFYKEQLQVYYDLFPREQIHVVVFEEMLRDPVGELAAVWDFLELEAPHTPVELPHRNQSFGPWQLGLQLMANRLLRHGMTREDPTNFLSHSETEPRRDFSSRARDALRRLNLRSRSYPEMPRETRAALGDLFAEMNYGISDLVGRDVSRHWPISV